MCHSWKKGWHLKGCFIVEEMGNNEKMCVTVGKMAHNEKICHSSKKRHT